MPDKRKRWVIYYDETMLRNMQRLREETAKKDSIAIEDVPVSRVVREVVAEKYVEYVDRQNNRSRITTIIERLDSSERTTEERLRALELAVRELIEIVRGGQGDL